MFKNLLVGLLLFVPLLFVSSASATVDVTVGASIDPPTTGIPFTVSYTKSSAVGDGQQTGNVVASFTGPESQTMSSKAYNVAEGVNAVLTWSVTLWTAGTYTFSFDDTASAGVEIDDSFDLNVEGAWNHAWTVAIDLSAGHDRFSTTTDKGLAVDGSGRPVIVYSEGKTGDSGYDSMMKHYSATGVLRWTSSTVGSPGTGIYRLGLDYDHSGRFFHFLCSSYAGSVELIQSVITDPNTGARVTSTEGSHPWPDEMAVAPPNCGTIGGVALPDYAEETVNYFHSWGNSIDRISRTDEFGDVQQLPWIQDTFRLTGQPNFDYLAALRTTNNDELIVSIHKGTMSQIDTKNFITFLTDFNIAPSTANPGKFAVIGADRSSADCKAFPSIIIDNTGDIGGWFEYDCPDFSVGEVNGAGHYYWSENNWVNFFLDSNDRPTACHRAQHNDGTYRHVVFSMHTNGDNNGGVMLDKLPGVTTTPTSTGACFGIVPDGNGGVYVAYTGTNNVYLTRLTANPDSAMATGGSQSYEPVPVGVPLPGGGFGEPGGEGGGNNKTTSLDFFRDSFIENWGMDEDGANWIMVLVIIIVCAAIGFAMFGFHLGGAALGGTLGFLLSRGLGYLPIWALLLMVLILLVLVGNVLFNRGGEVET